MSHTKSGRFDLAHRPVCSWLTLLYQRLFKLISTLIVGGWITFTGLLSFSVPQFPPMQNEDGHDTFFIESRGVTIRKSK